MTQKYVEPTDFNSTSMGLLGEALKYLQLPIETAHKWQNEVTRRQIVTAYKAIHGYMRAVYDQRTEGHVILTFPAKASMETILSSTYFSFILAMATNRRIVIDDPERRSLGLIRLKILEMFKPPHYKLREWKKIPLNVSLGCFSFKEITGDLEVSGSVWPQVVYTHSMIAREVRDAFGFHAAFFVGNFLFGGTVHPMDCSPLQNNTSVAYLPSSFKWRGEERLKRNLHNCNNESVLVEDNHSALCTFRHLLSASSITYPLGSLVGWFAMAMQGVAGKAIDLFDGTCIEFRNSQSGSLYHLYQPEKSFPYSSNNCLAVCGANIYDVRLFVGVLLW